MFQGFVKSFHEAGVCFCCNKNYRRPQQLVPPKISWKQAHVSFSIAFGQDFRPTIEIYYSILTQKQNFILN